MSYLIAGMGTVMPEGQRKRQCSRCGADILSRVMSGRKEYCIPCRTQVRAARQIRQSAKQKAKRAKEKAQ